MHVWNWEESYIHDVVTLCNKHNPVHSSFTTNHWNCLTFSSTWASFSSPCFSWIVVAQTSFFLVAFCRQLLPNWHCIFGHCIVSPFFNWIMSLVSRKLFTLPEPIDALSPNNSSFGTYFDFIYSSLTTRNPSSGNIYKNFNYPNCQVRSNFD
jgi:hypothetical protein